ncbi:MAG TPA: hypothetical protein VN437_00010 [Rectinemataceae bacterium]|nr:hypothetical protein [Rectinemataceae bacterium]
MTLQTRRRTYWALFGISLAMFLLGASLAILLGTRNDVPIFLIEHDIYKVHQIFGLRIPSHILSIFDVVSLSLFAVVVLAFILLSFRKTVSAEIFYFSFWLCTLSLESLRFLHLFLALSGKADSALAIVNKLYMGGHFLGYMAIFISGLYAAGMRNERHFAIMAVCAAISVALASILPVNTGIWEQSLMFSVGYGRLIEGFSFSIILITIANYLIAVRVRGDKAYYYIALGIAAIAAGSHFVSQDSSPTLSLASMLTMSLGSVIYIYKLHYFYLWQ